MDGDLTYSANGSLLLSSSVQLLFLSNSILAFMANYLVAHCKIHLSHRALADGFADLSGRCLVLPQIPVLVCSALVSLCIKQR